jgi:hypothetical protein
MINSSILYALSFNIVFFIQELFLALGKHWLGLKAYLYHNNHNWEGNHPMEMLAQGYGAAAIFLTGVIFFFLALITRRRQARWHLFFIWMSFQGFMQSLPQFITASSTRDTDTGQVFTYLGISDGAGLAIGVVSLFTMLILGNHFSRMLLELCPEKVISNPTTQFKYIKTIALWPAIIGALLCVPFRIMPWNRAATPLMLALISVPMVVASAWNAKVKEGHDDVVNHKILITPIVALIILLLIFQIVLAKGVVL